MGDGKGAKSRTTVTRCDAACYQRRGGMANPTAHSPGTPHTARRITEATSASRVVYLMVEDLREVHLLVAQWLR